jgi:hypothetical protein
MTRRDRFVELLNVDAEIKQVREWLTASKSRPSWWDAAELKEELSWMEQRRDQIVQALVDGRRFVGDSTLSSYSDQLSSHRWVM